MSGMIKRIRLFLQMFAEGGGDGGAGAGAAGAEAGGAAAQAPADKQTTPGKADDLSKVVYGRQPDAKEQADSPEADAGVPPDSTDQSTSHKPTFDELMQDPEYKAEFQKRFDKQFNKRFAENKSQQEREKKLAPALNLLAAKYGTAAGDIDALLEAINQDNDLIERQAYDKGMEPDAYREYNRVMAENQALKQAEADRQKQAQADATYQRWMQQAAEAQRIYPGLNLQNEVRNPQFAQLLGAGIDVATAYQVVHMGELTTQMLARNTEETKVNTVRAIQANQNRPRENGTSAPRAATVKSDPTKLKSRDFDEIIRRAARGDKINF